MVRLAVEDSEGAVELLQQEGAGYFVGEGEGGQGQAVVGGGRYGGVEAEWAADEKDRMAVGFQLDLQPGGQVGTAH